MLLFLLSIFTIYSVYGEESAFESEIQEKLLENEEVKKAFDLCKSDDYCPDYDCASNSHYNNFDDCIWKNISDSTQKNLSEVFAKKNLAPTFAPAVGGDSTDPARNKLQKYLTKRLQEALYGEVNEEGKKKQRMVRHVDFVHLFESQVSKNVILVVSSYCFDAYFDNSSNDHYKYLIPTDKQQIKANRKKNSKKLVELNPNDKASSSASIHWNGCIKAVQHICHKNTKKYNELSGNTLDLQGDSEHTQLIENSSKRACGVNDYIKKARLKLIYLAEAKKIYKKAGTNPHNITDSSVEMYTGRDGQKSIDEITSISSKELIETSGFKDANKQMVEDFKNNCNPDIKQKDGRNPEECAKYISKNKEAYEKNLDEYRIQSLAVQKKIEDLKDKEDVKKYLKQEGYGEEKIKEMVSDNNIEAIKAQIKNRYTQERSQIIKALTDEIKKRSIKKDEDITKNHNIGNIFNELQERSEYFQQLVHYNNIVSGYLTISNADEDKNTRNTKSIEIELADSPSSENKTEQKQFNEKKEILEESLGALKGEESDGDSDEENSTNTLGVDTINTTILNYDIELKNNP